MHRLTGLLGAVIPTCGNEIVIVEMPDQRGPAIVEHPLNHASGRVFIPSIGLEHRTLAIVGHGLRFTLVVIERRGISIASAQAIVENIDSPEALAPPRLIP